MKRLTTKDVAKVIGMSLRERPLGITQLIDVALLVNNFAKALNTAPVKFAKRCVKESEKE